MKTEKEIRREIEEIILAYSHVLRLDCAVIFTNAPRAIMQAYAQNKLDALYWVLGEPRPEFKCDKKGK